jgi:probable phosphoglycerate mutase
LTTFYLVRHATNPWVGHALAGDRPGLHLDDAGRRQAEELADRFEPVPIDAIYSSPLERAVETIQPLADRRALPIQRRPRLIEVGANAWVGRRFEDLESDDVWKRYNAFRSSTRALGGGELMTEIATRIVDELEELRERHPGGRCVLVSHGDVIKVAVAHYSGVPIDLMQRIEISPASASVIRLGQRGVHILAVNDTGSLVR